MRGRMRETRRRVDGGADAVKSLRLRPPVGRSSCAARGTQPPPQDGRAAERGRGGGRGAVAGGGEGGEGVGGRDGEGDQRDCAAVKDIHGQNNLYLKTVHISKPAPISEGGQRDCAAAVGFQGVGCGRGVRAGMMMADSLISLPRSTASRNAALGDAANFPRRRTALGNLLSLNLSF